jgi:nicotinamide-nucleotide amidase
MDTHESGYGAVMSTEKSELDRLAAEIAGSASAAGSTVAVAESLTGGMISSALAAAEGASEWFRGSLVAYSSEVKHEVLHVPDGPVVSAPAARAMARGVRRLLGADVAVAVTGAGGPAPQDGRPPGTVFLAIDDGASCVVVDRDLDGEPEEICVAAAEAALELLAGRFRSGGPDR